MIKFHPEHLLDLRKSGLSDETIKSSGIATIPPGQINKRLGTNIPSLTSAYEIPYPGCNGFSRFRCFYGEDGISGPKYLQRKSTGNHLYIPPLAASIIGDPEKTLYFTEGEKKALKACQEGLPCIGLSGLWNWKTKEGGLISDFDKIILKDRKIYLIPDNDYLKPNKHGYQKNLKKAVKNLEIALTEKGATVVIIELPDGPEKGIDDYLCKYTLSKFSELPEKIFHMSTIEEMIQEATIDDLDEILQHISQVGSSAKQERFIKQLAAKLDITLSAIKKDLKRYTSRTESGESGKDNSKMVALFVGLVDLVDSDGQIAFLIKARMAT